MSSKIGRPTDCKKEHDVKVRVDAITHAKLLEYCEKNNVTKAEAIRTGIQLLFKK